MKLVMSIALSLGVSFGYMAYTLHKDIQRLQKLNPVPVTIKLDNENQSALNAMVEKHLRIGGTSILRVQVSDETLYSNESNSIQVVKNKGLLFLNLTHKNKEIKATKELSLRASFILLAACAATLIAAPFAVAAGIPAYVVLVVVIGISAFYVRQTEMNAKIGESRTGSPVPLKELKKQFPEIGEK